MLIQSKAGAQTPVFIFAEMTTRNFAADTLHRQRRIGNSIYAPSELFFESKILGETYKGSQISNLSEETIRELVSEVAGNLASIEAVKENAEEQIRAGDFVDLDWLKRVRLRYNKTSNFKKLLLRELDVRAGLEGKDAAVRAIKKEKAKLDRHNEHQQKLKEYEFQKRKFFYGLVKEKMGDEVFEEMMQRAGEMASLIIPSPIS